MNNDYEIKQRIITKAEEMFLTFGVSKVTMEEIADSLGISKKTLYKHYSNKEHLLKEVIQNSKCEVDKFIDTLLEDDSIEFIEKLQRFMRFIAKQTSKLEGPYIQDLMKNYPECWRDIDEFKRKSAHRKLTKLIILGAKSGIFRKDIHAEVIVLGYVGAIHNLINPDVLSMLPFSAEQVFKDILKILFEGIFTPEGRNKYKTSILVKEKYGETLV
jgi:AcrR family transcriptional regulator